MDSSHAPSPIILRTAFARFAIRNASQSWLETSDMEIPSRRLLAFHFRLLLFHFVSRQENMLEE